MNSLVAQSHSTKTQPLAPATPQAPLPAPHTPLPPAPPIRLAAPPEPPIGPPLPELPPAPPLHPPASPVETRPFRMTVPLPPVQFWSPPLPDPPDETTPPPLMWPPCPPVAERPAKAELSPEPPEHRLHQLGWELPPRPTFRAKNWPGVTGMVLMVAPPPAPP